MPDEFHDCMKMRRMDVRFSNKILCFGVGIDRKYFVCLDEIANAACLVARFLRQMPPTCASVLSPPLYVVKRSCQSR